MRNFTAHDWIMEAAGMGFTGQAWVDGLFDEAEKHGTSDFWYAGSLVRQVPVLNGYGKPLRGEPGYELVVVPPDERDAYLANQGKGVTQSIQKQRDNNAVETGSKRKS